MRTVYINEIGRRTFADAGSLDLQSCVPTSSKFASCMFLLGRRAATSFLGSRVKSQGADHVVVKVTALPAAPPKAALKKEVGAIGEKQTDALHGMFKQVIASRMCSLDASVCTFERPVQT